MEGAGRLMSTKKPNILLITSDQQHWMTLGVNNPQIKTPNLDRLAGKGTVFTRAYCVNPTCTPTRASMITGQYPSQHGAYSLGTKLPEDATMLGDVLRQSGYHSALIGKAHFQPLKGTDRYPSVEAYPTLQDLDYWRDFHGPWYGFDRIELARNHTDEAHVGQHYALWLEEKGCTNWRDYFVPPTGTADPKQHWRWSIPEKYHYNAWIADRSNAMLEQYAGDNQPFFLWASFFDPHPKCIVPEPWDTMYDPDSIELPEFHPEEHDKNPPHFKLTQEKDPDFSAYHEPDGNGLHGFHSHRFDHDPAWLRKETAVYYGMVSLMDKYIGVILDKLDALGLTDNTLVVFTTDHGHFLGQHGLIAKGPFHYEDMVKVPFIVRWPGQVPEGGTDESLQSLVDLTPSFLAASGTTIPRVMTGLDQTDVWRGGERNKRDHVIVENRHNPTTMHARTYIDKRYKITVYQNQPYGELFDLEEDPREVNNLWDEPSARQLKSELMRKFLHAELSKEPIWMPRIAGA